MEELENELYALDNWFKWYDTQVIQYQRDIRLKNISSIDIQNLDIEATKKAARIKEIKTLIQDKRWNK